jgi:long-chain acyl-CoA synthetase
MLPNFSEILSEHSRNYPNKVFCEKINGAKVTFLELEKYVNQCCLYFEDLGISQDEILTIAVPNSISSIILYFAGLRSGIIVNPCPSSLSESELVKNIKFVETNLLITNKALSQKNKDVSCIKLIINNDEEFINFLKPYVANPFIRKIYQNNTACLYYSSGTTGNTKCVMYSHQNMVSLISSVVTSFNFSEKTIHLGILPLGHTAIINYSFLPAMFSGSTIYLAENFNSIRQNLWKLIRELEITYLQLVPTVLFSILATPYDIKDIESNNSLEFIGCGSAPLSIESQNNFYEKFDIKVANLYGLSETGPSHFDNPLLPSWRPGSVGYPLGVNESKVFDKDFNEVAIGKIGQIALKGKNIFIGYYKNEIAYKNAFFGEYFLTGDLGYKDVDGKYYFADREKDLIIKGGVNIVPGEIEEVIFKLKGVKSVAVIGIPNKIFGEEIVAFVEKKDDFLLEEEVFNICLENLQVLKRPNKVVFIDSMLIGPSGKILKKKMKEQLMETLNY